MYSVGQYLKRKGQQVWFTHPDATVYEALELMAEKDIGALLVVEGEHLIGIISERDYARKVILKGKSSLATPVREIMTPDVVIVEPRQTVDECMALMTAKRVRYLPVVVDGKVAGVVSIGDLVKASLDEKDFLINQLERYITGTR